MDSTESHQNLMFNSLNSNTKNTNLVPQEEPHTCSLLISVSSIFTQFEDATAVIMNVAKSRCLLLPAFKTPSNPHVGAADRVKASLIVFPPSATQVSRHFSNKPSRRAERSNALLECTSPN